MEARCFFKWVFSLHRLLVMTIASHLGKNEVTLLRNMRRASDSEIWVDVDSTRDVNELHLLQNGIQNKEINQLRVLNVY